MYITIHPPASVHSAACCRAQRRAHCVHTLCVCTVLRTAHRTRAQRSGWIFLMMSAYMYVYSRARGRGLPHPALLCTYAHI